MTPVLGPPPKTVTIDGKRYFEADAIEQHLRDLRTALTRCEIRCAEEHAKRNK